MNAWRFADRAHAGKLLAEQLQAYSGRADVVVLGLPRGGVSVASEVAAVLGTPFDVVVVRKLGVPFQPELAMGAIAMGGVRVVNDPVVRALGITPEMIDRAALEQQRETERREQVYRNGRPPLPLAGKVVVIVDDGLATGSTMRAAVEAVRRMRPARVVVAVPVGASDTCRDVAALVDEMICLQTPEPFVAVGLWYDDFAQTTDEQVRALLAAQPCLP